MGICEKEHSPHPFWKPYNTGVRPKRNDIGIQDQVSSRCLFYSLTSIIFIFVGKKKKRPWGLKRGSACRTPFRKWCGWSSQTKRYKIFFYLSETKYGNNFFPETFFGKLRLDI